MANIEGVFGTGGINELGGSSGIVTLSFDPAASVNFTHATVMRSPATPLNVNTISQTSNQVANIRSVFEVARKIVAEEGGGGGGGPPVTIASSPPTLDPGHLWFDTDPGVNNGQLYLRVGPPSAPSATWVSLGPMLDAPEDGHLYARMDGEWAQFTPGGGGNGGGGIPEPPSGSGHYLRTGGGAWSPGLPLSGGTMTGQMTFAVGQTFPGTITSLPPEPSSIGDFVRHNAGSNNYSWQPAPVPMAEPPSNGRWVREKDGSNYSWVPESVGEAPEEGGIQEPGADGRWVRQRAGVGNHSWQLETVLAEPPSNGHWVRRVGGGPNPDWVQETVMDEPLSNGLWVRHKQGSTYDWQPAPSGNGASVHIGLTPPLDPDEGAIWWKNEDPAAKPFIYYDDAWVVLDTKVDLIEALQENFVLVPKPPQSGRHFLVADNGDVSWEAE